jgi:UDP-GlcNAc:undecaprenyl-phosphate GlcNAc-1-phosphate transferase
LDAGYRPGAIAVGLMAVSALMGLSAAVAVKAGVYRPLLVLSFLFLIALYYLLTTDRARAVAFFRRLRLGRPEATRA